MTIQRLKEHTCGLPSELRATTQHVLLNPHFIKAPASANKHHAYEGGLAVHTLEVLEKALTMRALGPDWVVAGDPKNILITAAIWHDFAKIWETEKVEHNSALTPFSYVKTPYRNLIRHVAGSYARFLDVAERYEVSPHHQEQIGHCILSHHGRYEWGSPVEPQTEEAFILHAADQWSALYGPGRNQ